jgi:hypothetical protein
MNLSDSEKWLNEKILAYEKDPDAIVQDLLISTHTVMMQYKLNPESAAAKGVFDSCVKHNELFFEAVNYFD